MHAEVLRSGIDRQVFIYEYYWLRNPATVVLGKNVLNRIRFTEVARTEGEREVTFHS